MRLTRRFDAADAGGYYKLPLNIPENIAALRIAYHYPEGDTVDIALEGPDGMLVGASGSNKPAFSVFEHYATPGYKPCPITAGTWQLILGAYHVSDGCEVAVDIELVPKAPVWLRGDTHLHSVHSDGVYTTGFLCEQAKAEGLDFLFLTDHNTTSQNDSLDTDEQFTLLPGVEITYFGGHYNLLGVAHPVRSYFANTREEIISIMREGRENGALLSVNHPFCDLCPWTFGFDVPFDLLEVWNGPFTGRNYKALQFWDSLLKQGQKLYVIGGSDAHRSTPFIVMGAPTLFVSSLSRGASDILDAIRTGRTCIGFTPDAPRIELSAGSAALINLSAGDEIALVSDKGIIGGGRCEQTGAMTFTVPDAGQRYTRVEVWRQFEAIGKLMAAMSNPVFYDR